MNGKSNQSDLSCEDVRELLDLLAAGDLPEDEAAEYRAHLDDCPACRAEYDRIAAVTGLVAAGLQSAIPEGSESANVWPKVREQIAGRKPRRSGLRWLTVEPVRLIGSAVAVTVGLYILVSVQWTSDLNGNGTPPMYESAPVIVTDAKIDERPARVTGFEFGDGETVMLWLE